MIKWIIIERKEDIPTNDEIEKLLKQGFIISIVDPPRDMPVSICREAVRHPMMREPEEPLITIRFTDKPTIHNQERRINII